MWAQMIKSRVKPGQEASLQEFQQDMERRSQSGEISGGPSRIIVLQDQNDPGAFINLIFFESEAKAREYEGSPRQVEIQQRMMQIMEGPPQFTDLNVLYEFNS